MFTSAFVPLIGAVALALMIAAFHRRVAPRPAARVLTAALLLVALAALPSLWIVGLGFLGHLPFLGHLLGWCASAVGLDEPISPFVGVPAVAASVFGIVRMAQVLATYRRTRVSRWSPVNVAAEHVPVAYTLPGSAGRVVVSTGLVSMLAVDELDVVLAHERAHGVHRHDRMVLLARLSQAALPVLRPLRDRLLFTLERWADEDAVIAAGGDRRFVARTIAKVALQASVPVSALSIAGLGVPARVDALLRPPTMDRSSVLLSSIWLAIAGTAVMASYQLHHLAAFVSALCPG